jgi:hypothetical protein
MIKAAARFATQNRAKVAPPLVCGPPPGFESREAITLYC